MTTPIHPAVLEAIQLEKRSKALICGAILAYMADGTPVAEAYDRVLGAGAYAKLYDAVSAIECAPIPTES
jgi:hypothetical protein